MATLIRVPACHTYCTVEYSHHVLGSYTCCGSRHSLRGPGRTAARRPSISGGCGKTHSVNGFHCPCHPIRRYGVNVRLAHSTRPCFFFFFKQKTAYEISECDWSSDV